MNARLLSTAIAALTACLLSVPASNADEIAEIIKQASRRAVVVELPAREQREARALFAKTFEGKASLAELQPAWRELGMELQAISVRKQSVWLLRESSDARKGRGIYMFRRPDATHPVQYAVLQAPHSFYDRHTREITANLFVQSRFAAAAWNTVHRSKQDLAHRSGTYWQAYHESLLESPRPLAIFQLHGFSAAKRRSPDARTADVILSNATLQPSIPFMLAADEMQNTSRWKVRLYPRDVAELGGRTNLQGQHSLGHPRSTFFHVELSAQLREQLQARKSTQSEFLKLLEKAYRKVSRD